MGEMSNLLIFLIVVISFIVGIIGRMSFKRNEPKVVAIQKEVQKVPEGETVDSELKRSLRKATTVSLNYKKLEILGFTISGCVLVFSILKVLFL